MAAVSNPTWYADIRHMFVPDDINHMAKQGLDLTSYDNVVANAGDIYAQVAAGNMPPGRPWTSDHPDWIATFLNWITASYPKGTDPGPPAPASLLARTANVRIRKDIEKLTGPELDKVKAAFAGILAKPPTDPNSFFAQAGLHWLPSPIHCQHHVAAYNPWHRAYMLGFENALRSVPGCEDVTLPYWDISKPFPDVLKHPPFDSYTLPRDIGEGFAAGYKTTRFDYGAIQKNLLANGVVDDINNALTKTDWEDFHGLFAGASNNAIISAHDGAHDSIGETMSNPLVAAFDPVFFFFHANWDRLFWEWQKKTGATTLNGLLSTINKTTDPVSYQIFTLPALQALPPFTTNAPHQNSVSIIDSRNSLGVDYESTPEVASLQLSAKTTLSLAAAKKFHVATDRVNVRVDGVDRLKIPGSFLVHLLRNGQTIATRGFFQPAEATKCETCASKAKVHFDFELPLAEVSPGPLEVSVEPLDKSFVGARFPHKLMGEPTVSVRLLMRTE